MLSARNRTAVTTRFLFARFLAFASRLTRFDVVVNDAMIEEVIDRAKHLLHEAQHISKGQERWQSTEIFLYVQIGQ